MKPQYKCPKCGAANYILVERRPDGDAECTSCKYKGKSTEFETKNTKDRIEELEILILGYQEKMRPLLEEWWKLKDGLK